MACPAAKGNTTLFIESQYIVYPPHGVGLIKSIENQEISGYNLQLYVIHFERDKMCVKVPVGKVTSLGLRKLSSADELCEVKKVLATKAKIKKSLWSRRAQEYEAKINSGDIKAMAEVVRDLYRAEENSQQSYSERQFYEIALDRLCREIAAVEGKDLSEVIENIEKKLFELRTKDSEAA